MVLHLTAKIGQMINLPGVGLIQIKEKSGRCVKLSLDFHPEQKVELLPQQGAVQAVVTK